jgi:hypothetical protein
MPLSLIHVRYVQGESLGYVGIPRAEDWLAPNVGVRVFRRVGLPTFF